MTDLNTRTPPGDDAIQRTDLKPAFSNDLLEQMLSRANLQEAWLRVRINGVRMNLPQFNGYF
ncbi:MAG: hypothetical protein COB04_04340 [Gammaproteobacteria bacterium]|nr:MAG: hypothetical protein COB04_04340 [Gammaproteobacteria bacterium]